MRAPKSYIELTYDALISRKILRRLLRALHLMTP